ncbi:hypothetical protein OZK63_41045, partial [Streptomyces sp. UMAF16]|nr:hypothetical protein [Streptomyces sp. UMAF16]
KGQKVFLSGNFRQRYKSEENFEFKINQLYLLETLKERTTRMLEINMEPVDLTKEWIDFLAENVKAYPGKTLLKFNIIDNAENLKISLYN